MSAKDCSWCGAPKDWRLPVPVFRARESFGRWIVERELPCINGLSAWFAICSVDEPDEQEAGYSEGACGTAEENARRIAEALSA